MSQFNQDFYSDQRAGGYGQQQGYGQSQQQGNYYAQPQQQGGYPGQHQQGWGEGNWEQQGAVNQGYEMPSGGGYTNQQMMYSQGGGGGGYSGDVMEVDPTPATGTMGQMTPRDNNASYGDGSSGYGFEDEPPLLEELGIDFSLIKENTMSVLNPLKPADANALSNTDLAGPLLFCLLFGVVLLLTGKVHFGYIYGVGLLGCTSLYVVLNLMSAGGVSIGCIVSVLGYCLLPMVILSLVSVIISLNGILGMPLAFMFICWCSYSASKLFVSVLSMESQQLLVAYPCALIYGVFALLTVF